MASKGAPTVPNLRNPLDAVIRRNLIVTMACSLTGGFLFWLLHNRPKRAKYAEFYSNYDGVAAFEDMEARGLMDCTGDNKNKKDDD